VISYVFLSTAFASGTCASGDLDACALDGSALLAEKRHDEAMAVLIPACDKGGLLACYNLAAEHMRNQRVDDALPHFERTCAGDLAIGCADLGFLIATGAGVPRDPQRGFALTESGCQLGYAPACGEAASMMVSGYGTSKDETRALTYMTSACLQGHPPSCAKAGAMAESGMGIEPNSTEAATWYARACNASEATGCLRLAQLHNTAGAFPAALTAATRGCELGDGLACASAAMAHLRGRGVEKNAETAQSLFRASCDAGYGDGCKALEELKNRP
jgi:uncharacterized protein